jgi:glycopeptide antibiotics resistance protein
MLNVNYLVKWFFFGYLIILVFLSWNPWILPDPNQAVGVVTWDLIDHAIAYSGLSILMMSVFKLKHSGFKLNFLVILISSMIGIFFECGQYLFTLHRQFSLFDVTANTFGALFGVLIWRFISSCTRHFFIRDNQHD